MRFLYVMDPMCGWCYAFQPELEAFLGQQNSVQIDWIMGGLAPDSKVPMDDEMKQRLSSYWYQLEEKTQVTFNHDFWKLNTPYRSTYPACRAVVSAEHLKAGSAQSMVKAIQSAYYQQAKNPALDDILIECAKTIGLDERAFSEAYTSEGVAQRFHQHLSIARQLQVNGFPALFFIDDKNHAYPLTLGFCQTADLLERFKHIQEQVLNG